MSMPGNEATKRCDQYPHTKLYTHILDTQHCHVHIQWHAMVIHCVMIKLYWVYWCFYAPPFSVSIQNTALARNGSSSPRHGDSVMLTCSVTLDPAVDTAVMLTVRHTGPPISTDITNTTTAMVLSGPQDFSYRVTPSVAGMFTFTCTVVATDATNSVSITNSTEGMATTKVTIGIIIGSYIVP